MHSCYDGPRKEFCCFLLPNREPKEDGGRGATVRYRRSKLLAGDPAVVRGSCRLPRFMAAPGTVKSSTKNSPGNRHVEPPDHLPANTGENERSPVHNRYSAGCPAGQRMLCRHADADRRLCAGIGSRRRCDHAAHHDPGLHSDPRVVQRKIALAPIRQRRDDRHRCRWLRNLPGTKFAAPYRLHQRRSGRRRAFRSRRHAGQPGASGAAWKQGTRAAPILSLR